MSRKTRVFTRWACILFAFAGAGVAGSSERGRDSATLVKESNNGLRGGGTPART